MVRRTPMMRGSSQGPSASGTSPRRANTSTNLARSPAITRSQASARCAPIPAAVPLTAAITGTSQSSNASNSAYWPSSIMRRASPMILSGTSVERSGSS